LPWEFQKAIRHGVWIFSGIAYYEALGNNYRVCGVYSPEACAEVYCARLNFTCRKFLRFIKVKVKPNFVANFVFFGTAASFIDK